MATLKDECKAEGINFLTLIRLTSYKKMHYTAGGHATTPENRKQESRIPKDQTAPVLPYFYYADPSRYQLSN